MRRAERWYFMYSLAEEYYKHYENLKVPKDFKTKNGYEYDESGFNLSNWLITQRRAYKSNITGKKVYNCCPLTLEQIKLLNKIGMIWDNKINTNKRWVKIYTLVKAYYIHFGTLEMPEDFKTKNGYEYDQTGINIYAWLDTQRLKFTKNILSEEKVSLLNEIGMKWRLKPTWKEMYGLAKKYFEHYGNLKISYNFKTKNGYEYDKNGFKLGEWICHQRAAYKNNIAGKKVNNSRPLTLEQIKLLEDIDMIWSFDVEKNRTNLEQLLKALSLEYNFNFLDYPEIFSLSTNEVIERTLYLKEHRLPFAIDGKLNPLFFEKAKEKDKGIGLILKH